MNEKTLPPIATPWGISQSRREIGKGMEFVSTASHGGIWLSDDRLTCLPLPLSTAPTFSQKPNWFEEDIDSILPVLAFPAEFIGEACFHAVMMARNYKSSANGRLYPLVKHCREFLETEISLIVRKRAQLWFEVNNIKDKWERGSCCSDRGGWHVWLNRGHETREVLFSDYPSQNWYTDEELDAIAKQSASVLVGEN